MMIVSVTILMLLLHGSLSSAVSATKKDQAQLLKTLMATYNKQVRPVSSVVEVINVSFSLVLNQLMKVDDRAQTIKTRIWVRQSWKNDFLLWNLTTWPNIKSLYIDPELLWVPDIVLYNDVESSFPGGTEVYKTKVQADYDGTQSWNSPASFQSTCVIDVKYFPFDQQVCYMKFGSWAFDTSKLNMTTVEGKVSTKNLAQNSQWEIKSVSLKRNTVKYLCCPSPFVDVTVQIRLRRKPLYYIFNLILPCYLLIVVTLMSFFLPPESGERISLTITVLLAVAVFLQLVSDSLPRNSDRIPVLGVFFLLIMGETALSLVTTSCVLIIHFKGENDDVSPMPRIIKKIFIDKIGRFLRVKEAILLQKEFNPEAPKTLKYNDGEVNTISNGHTDEDDVKMFNDGTHRNSTREVVYDEGAEMREQWCPEEKDETLEAILSELKEITKEGFTSESSRSYQHEWKVLATVLDQIIFIIFLLTCFASSYTIIEPAYRYDK